MHDAAERLGWAIERLHHGEPPADLARRFRSGELTRIATGQYVDTCVWAEAGFGERIALSAAAHGLRHRGAVLCGTGALALAGVDVPTPRELSYAVTARGHAGLKPSRFAVVGSGEIQARARRFPAPRTRLHFHPAATEHFDAGVLRLQATPLAFAETLVNAAPMRAFACADALVRWRPDLHAARWAPLYEALEHEPRRNRRERALAFLKHASMHAESVGESMARFLVMDLGFPEPVLQLSMRDADGYIGDVDLGWPEHGVLLEFDGAAKHVEPAMTGGHGTYYTVNKAAHRTNRLNAVCRKLIHLRWADLSKPQHVRSILLAAGLPMDLRRRPW